MYKHMLQYIYMANVRDLDLFLKKKSLNMTEFQKVIYDERVSSVQNVESDKKFYMRYKVNLVNSETYFVYVKMTMGQILKMINHKS